MDNNKKADILTPFVEKNENRNERLKAYAEGITAMSAEMKKEGK